VRTREHLLPDKVERLIIAAHQSSGRVAERDALLIMMAYRHALRASEIAALRWDQIDLKAGMLHVTRLKNGSPSTHPLRGPRCYRKIHVICDHARIHDCLPMQRYLRR
jgi:integrase